MAPMKSPGKAPAPAPAADSPPRWRRVVGAVCFWGALGLVLAWNFPYHRWLQHANELPRIFMTMALVEEGSFAIDTYRGAYRYRKAMDLSRSFCLGPRILKGAQVRLRVQVGEGGRRAARQEGDRWRGGGRARLRRYRPPPKRWPCRERHFSNKAPGMSLLATPAYAALRARWAAQGRTPDVKQVRDPRFRQARLRQAIYWARLTTATLPAFLFLLLLAWWLRPWVPEVRVRRLAVAAYGLGTLAFTYSVQLMSHQLATALLFSGLIWVDAVARRRLRWGWLFVAGLAAGAALCCDYQLVFAAVPLAVYALWWVRPWWRLGLAALGAAPPLAVLLYYHHAAFGSILWTGYEFLVATHDQALHAKGVLGISTPRWEAFWGSFFAPDNGLFYFSPWLLIALGGLTPLWRGHACGDGPGRATGDGSSSAPGGRPWWRPTPLAVLLIAVIAIYVYFISALTFWRGGWQTGPRYIAAMLPCFVLPYALVLRRALDRPLRWAAAVGPALFAMGVYALVVTGFPHFPDKFKYPLFDLVAPLLRDGYVGYNLGRRWLGLSGWASLVPYLAVLAGLGLYLAGGASLLRGPRPLLARTPARTRDSTRPGAPWRPSRRVAGVLAISVAAWVAAGYAHLARRGIARARPHPVQGNRGERYGHFLQRAHRDIRRNWEPRPLARPPRSLRLWRGQRGGTSRRGRSRRRRRR